jgi:hypothetical protein
MGDSEERWRMAEADRRELEATVHRLHTELAASQRARRTACQALEVIVRSGEPVARVVALTAITTIEQDAA